MGPKYLKPSEAMFTKARWSKATRGSNGWTTVMGSTPVARAAYVGDSTRQTPRHVGMWVRSWSKLENLNT